MYIYTWKDSGVLVKVLPRCSRKYRKHNTSQNSHASIYFYSKYIPYIKLEVQYSSPAQKASPIDVPDAAPSKSYANRHPFRPVHESISNHVAHLGVVSYIYLVQYESDERGKEGAGNGYPYNGARDDRP